MKFNLKEWIRAVSQILANMRDNTEPLIIYKDFTYTRSSSLSAGSSITITGTQAGFSIPTGYSLLGIKNAWSATDGVEIEQFRLGGGSGQFCRIKNGSSSAISDFTVHIGVNFIRSDYIKQIT